MWGACTNFSRKKIKHSANLSFFKTFLAKFRKNDTVSIHLLKLINELFANRYCGSNKHIWWLFESNFCRKILEDGGDPQMLLCHSMNACSVVEIP